MIVNVSQKQQSVIRDYVSELKLAFLDRLHRSNTKKDTIDAQKIFPFSFAID